MIKAKTIKSFFYARGKDIYLDEERFKELEKQGYVIAANDEKVIDEKIETTQLIVNNNPVETKVIKTKK